MNASYNVDDKEPGKKIQFFFTMKW